MANTVRIVSIESATLSGQRPRHAGYNSRLKAHGTTVNVPIVRICTEDGIRGFGYSRATRENLTSVVGKPIHDLISTDGQIAEHARFLEFPLLDWLGQYVQKPVYKIIARDSEYNIQEPFHVGCYDTSLYIDDLHLENEQEAAELIAGEARAGYEQGHRAFKIKVGRGARHMELDAGTRRDIAVIRAVRDAVGVACVLMIDANNGYNLNLTKRVLAETAECNLYWIEEAFHEDRVLYEDLRGWLEQEGLNVLIADGEGQASPTLMDWARDGIIDVVQYDIFDYGFANWLITGNQLDSWGVKSAPHHYGRHIGNFYSGHLATAIEHFTMVEWDDVTTPGLDTSGYSIQQGTIYLPNLPGFGIVLDDDLYTVAINENGLRITQ